MKIRIFSDIKVNFINSEDILKKNVIYKLTFPSNKVYIGQTSQKLRERISRHCSDAFSSDINTIKNNAIRKYLTFKVEVLYQGDDLDIQEIYYINKYQSTNKEFGYNLESGGNLNKVISEESRKKMSDSHKGKKVSEETKKKISKNSAKSRPVIITDLSTNIETKFNSIRDAANFYNVVHQSISIILCGKNKTFKNKQYTAKYAD